MNKSQQWHRCVCTFAYAQMKSFRVRHRKSLYSYFEEMMSDGLIISDEPKILAAEFTAPITGIVHLIDREPEKEEQAMDKIKAYMEHFVHIYRKNKNR